MSLTCKLPIAGRCGVCRVAYILNVSVSVRCSREGVPVWRVDEKSEKYIISIGFIDVVTPYTFKRSVESKVKRIYREPTICEPREYAQRLKNFLFESFVNKSYVCDEQMPKKL